MAIALLALARDDIHPAAVTIADRVRHRREPVLLQQANHAGTAEVVKDGYPDSFAWQSNHKYYDEASTPEKPVWYMIDIKLLQIFRTPVTRLSLAEDPECSQMMVLKKGSRLSIQPVTEAEWMAVHRLAGQKT